MAYFLYAVVMLVALAAVALNVLSVPGNWVLLLLAIGLSAFKGWQAPSVFWLLVILVILVAGEVVEFVSSMIGAKKFGASTAAAWAAIAGAFAGGILGIALPIPVVGSIVGAILGAFVAALLAELFQYKPLKQATWAAIGAALGRAMGMVTKIACGLAAWFALLFSAFPG